VARLGFAAWTFALALAPGGCGDSEPAPRAPDPAGPVRASLDEAGVRALVAGLRHRVERGTGLDDPAFGRDAAYLATLLWPDAADAAHDRARRDHARVTNVAGDLARPLAKGADARADLGRTDPVGLEIHDAWLAASDRAPDLYRAWVEGAGAALTKRLEAERAKLFERR
jgi:hypothetical protein